MALRVSAIRRRDLQIEVVVHVAVQTGYVCVPVRQRETDGRGGVVDGDTDPTIKGVARFARLRELRRHVIRIRGPLKILLVTRNASS